MKERGWNKALLLCEEEDRKLNEGKKIKNESNEQKILTFSIIVPSIIQHLINDSVESVFI